MASSTFSSTAQPLSMAEMSSSLQRNTPPSTLKKKISGTSSSGKSRQNDSLFGQKLDSSSIRKPLVGKRKQVSFLDKYRARTNNQSVRSSRLNFSRSQMSGIDTPPEQDSQIDESEHLNIMQYVSYKFSEGSPLGTAITLTMSAAIGPGMLSLAYAVSASGLGFGILQLFICALLGYFSLLLLTKTARLTGRYSYADIADALFGPGFAFFVKIIFFLNNWGAAIADIMLMNDMISTAFQDFLSNSNVPDMLLDPNSNFWPIVLGTFVVFPLCLKRTLKGLRFVLLIAFSLTVYVTIIIILKAATGYSTQVNSVQNFIPAGIFTTLPIGFFAYTCHPNVLEAYEELDFKQTKRMRGVLSRTMITIFILYSLIGGLGYFSLASTTSALATGNLLLAYPQTNDYTVEVAILVFSITMTISLPLGIKPVKDCLHEIVSPNEKEDSNLKHFILTFVTLASIIAVSMFVKNMSTVVAFLGASTNSLICFNLPCLYYIKACRTTKNKTRMMLAQIVNIILFVFSAFSVGYMTYQDLTGSGGNSPAS